MHHLLHLHRMQQVKKSSRIVPLNVGLEEKLHRELKAILARKGLTLREWVSQSAKLTVDRNGQRE